MLTRREFTARSAALMAASGLRLPLWQRALRPMLAPETPVQRPLLLGVDYYPDQTPENL